MQHRLKRRTLWVSLWLARVFAFLWLCGGAQKSRVWREWFDEALRALALQVMGIVLCHAALRVDEPRKSHAISLRATYGSALRRAFKAKGFAGRLAKIRRALDECEMLIARLCRRLRRGMSRMNAAHTRVAIGADVALLSALRAKTICVADTS